MIRKYLFLLLGLLLAVACKKEGVEAHRNEVLVELMDAQLTSQALAEAIGEMAHSPDSAAIADAYIRQWIENILIFEKARKNIDHLDEINRLTEEYRRQLIIFEYEKQLVAERLSKEISEDQLQTFFEANKLLFKLNEPIVRGLFLKIPVNAPQLAEVKQWIRKITPETLERIEKYSLQHAIVFEYFNDRWIPLSQLLENIPYQVNNLDRFLKEHRLLEITEGDYWYYLAISEYELSGAIQPFEYARNQILEVLQNLQKKQFIEKIGVELYQEALRGNKIKFSGIEPPAFK